MKRGRNGSARRRPLSRPRPRLPEQLGELRLDPREALAVSELSRLGARNDHEVVASRQQLLRLPESLPQQALYPVALDGAADFAADRQAESWLVVVTRLARERVEDQVAPGMRSAFPVDAVEFRASGQAPAPGSGHRLRGQSLALLVTAALQDEAPGLRLHPLAEAVGASPLALLRLVRALHAVGECSPPPIPRISALLAGMQPKTG